MILCKIIVLVLKGREKNVCPLPPNVFVGKLAGF